MQTVCSTLPLLLRTTNPLILKSTSYSHCWVPRISPRGLSPRRLSPREDDDTWLLAWTFEEHGGSSHPNFEFANLLHETQVDTRCEFIQLSAGGQPICKKRQENTDSNWERDAVSLKKNGQQVLNLTRPIKFSGCCLWDSENSVESLPCVQTLNNYYAGLPLTHRCVSDALLSKMMHYNHGC